jgi:GH15 family glucan-1,4-alpha-glucosidase
MCWVALDRLLKLGEAGHLDGLPADRFRRERDAIRKEVELRGYSHSIGSYVSVFGEDDVDASLLLLARYGFEDPRSSRMLATCERIHQRLGHRGMLYRYHDDDGLPGEEGAFGVCSFWAVDCLCRQGETDAAERSFEHLCSLSNDVGLYAEEFDPETGAPLGNFPQAFTHLGLIDAALTLAQRTGRGAGMPTRSDEHEVEARR